MTLDVPGPITLDEPLLMLEAARAGVGIAYMGITHVAEDLASGRLDAAAGRVVAKLPGHLPVLLRAGATCRRG